MKKIKQNSIIFTDVEQKELPKGALLTKEEGINISFKSGIKPSHSDEMLLRGVKRRVLDKLPVVIDTKTVTGSTIERVKKIAEENFIETNTVSQQIQFQENVINDDIKLDIIGDVHGLYDELIELIKKLGYDNEGNHPEGRKLLFLGDLVDRGPKSLSTILFVKDLVEHGGHYCIMGNHEETLLNNIKRYFQGDKPYGGHAALKTFSDIVKAKKMKEVALFLLSLPGYYIQGDYAFVHGDLTTFEPLETPYTELIYGGKNDKEAPARDEAYEANYLKGLNKFKLIRGHIKGDNTHSSVCSLDEEQTFNGNLVAMRLPLEENFESSKVRVSCNYTWKGVEKPLKKYQSMVKSGSLIEDQLSLALTRYIGSEESFIVDFAGNLILRYFNIGLFIGKDPYSGETLFMNDGKLSVKEDIPDGIQLTEDFSFEIKNKEVFRNYSNKEKKYI